MFYSDHTRTDTIIGGGGGCGVHKLRCLLAVYVHDVAGGARSTEVHSSAPPLNVERGGDGGCVHVDLNYDCPTRK